MAEVFLLPVAIKLAFFAGKCSEMEKRSKRSRFWSIADHFEAIKIVHFTAPLNEFQKFAMRKLRDISINRLK